ncbi:hypothetical protein P0W76_21360, partial [Tsukamurella sp. 8J]|nr:hypothetical protein [Tsukamurella sp. 8J]
AITARARSKGTVLLVRNGSWDGAGLHLHAGLRGYTGLGARPGRGRIRTVDVAYAARGRGCLGGRVGTSAQAAALAVAR